MVSELLVVSKISLYGVQVSCSPTEMMKFTLCGGMAVGRRKKLPSTSASREMGRCQYYLAATMARFTCCMGGMITIFHGYADVTFMKFISTT